MTYMTYNLIYTMMTLIPILVWFGVSIWVAVDADKMPAEAWTLSGESRTVWTAIAILLAWPFGLLFYLFIVRKKIADLARSINDDALITKAANRLRKEQDKRNAYVPAAEAQSTEAYEPETSDEEETKNVSYRNKSLRGVMTSAEAVKTSHGAAVDTPASDEQVFNYEESDASEDRYDSGQVVPPKPDYAPTVGSNQSKENDDSETKTTAYPVIPPKPTQAPRVDKDGTEG